MDAYLIKGSYSVNELFPFYRVSQHVPRDHARPISFLHGDVQSSAISLSLSLSLSLLVFIHARKASAEETRARIFDNLRDPWTNGQTESFVESLISNPNFNRSNLGDGRRSTYPRVRLRSIGSKRPRSLNCTRVPKSMAVGGNYAKVDSGEIFPDDLLPRTSTSAQRDVRVVRIT